MNKKCWIKLQLVKNVTYLGVGVKFLWNTSSGTNGGGGGLEKEIKSGESFAVLVLFWDDGGGAIKEFDGLLECPGLGLDLLNCLSYLIDAESVSLIEEARVTGKVITDKKYTINKVPYLTCCSFWFCGWSNCCSWPI